MPTVCDNCGETIELVDREWQHVATHELVCEGTLYRATPRLLDFTEMECEHVR